MIAARSVLCWFSLCTSIFLVPFLASAADSSEKPVRLRNQQITTPTKHETPRKPVTGERVSGLYLVQFIGPVEAPWREELKEHRLKLLRFVPEDSFVARLHNADLNLIQALPFVRWIGQYEPQHKVHALLNRAKGRGAEEKTQIRILLSPDAGADELDKARGMLSRFDHLSSTRFGHIVDGSATPQQINALAGSDDILWIEPAAKIKLFDEISTKITAGEDGQSGTLAVVHQLGYDGFGVTVSVADSGLQEGNAETMHPDLAGRVPAFFHYGTLTDAADEHSHGTHVAGIVAGNGAAGEADAEGYLYGLGVAPGAEIVAQRLFDGAGGYHAPPTYEKMTRDAVRAGAEIGSNSWGDDTQGRYDLSAAEFDALVRDADLLTAGDQPYILEFSAGNAGPGQQTIGSPAVAKNVIATGATENDRFDFFVYDSGRETMADFSSRGPCEDGRIKPDVVAPGTWISSLRSSLANDENAWAAISDNYLYQGGTSQAGPHVSGAAAVFVQFYRETVTNATPSPALVKAALINSATDIDDGTSTGPIPNNDEGWGRVDLVELIDSTKRYQFIDQSAVLATGQTFEHRLLVASADEPLRITLAYSDVPGFPATIPALVNDLDLEVVAPDGSVFSGNQFEDAESVPNTGATDHLNNVEAVHLAAPVPGEYIVRIHARNVPEDARVDTAQADQDFALVISANIPLPGAGVLFFDRRSYSAPGTMRLQLIDFNLAGQSWKNVLVGSSTEGNGENYTLYAKGNNGVFTNSIQTATGTAAVDGRLQIAHGDLITAIYQDASPVAERVANARADLLPPVITNVFVTNRFGRTLACWQTDELSDSYVKFGTNSVLSLSATNRDLTVNHEVALDGLLVGRSYQFFVSSADEAGNRATNNNGGALFSFIAPRTAVILLVDSYTDGLFPVPPLSGYTDALDQLGISYEVWNVPTNGSPSLNTLRPFGAVIWRVSEFTDSWTAGERTTLSNYLNQGGALLVATMEGLSRLDETGGASFRSNVLHVLNYTADVGAPEVYGVDSDPISSGMQLILDYSPYDDAFKEAVGIPSDISDTLVIAPDASPIFFEPLGAPVGLRYPRVGQDSAGRVVFLGYPIDAVPLSGIAPDNRVNLLRNLVSFLVPGVNGIGTIALDRSAYTIPSQVTVEVADSDHVGAGQITINFFSDTAATGQTLALHETTRPGLFRGFISLVPNTAPPSSGELRVKNGDLIWTEYQDLSDRSIVRAIAEIDTTPPTISNIKVTTEYQEAVVSWTTSKPTDALVQFGESAFLNRTAYAANLSDEHSVVLTGLQADKKYYFKIVSRDQAGNTTEDDNNGALHTFYTKKPFSVPWFDNLENGGTNWIVVDGETRTTTWQWGTPNNGWETSAHSGLNAWGSNLRGNGTDLGDTSLIGPAISLTGGTRATLKFWNSYDFTLQSDLDIYEFGALSISTNNGNSWIDVATFEEFSDGWEEAQIDLTPYVGRVIRVGFYYGFFSLEGGGHPGWLVDDISVTVSTPDEGTIVVTNNLAQGSFQLSGPISRSGSGWITTFLDCPFGNYSITFNPVPFYQTPIGVTNSLSSAGPLTFLGNYTFNDANTNGISDPWEQQYFGQVSAGRTAQTDSDADGMPDFAEFIAGTDPTNSSSALRFQLPTRSGGSSIEVRWSSVPGRAYRLHSSADLVSWMPVTGWIQATATNMSSTASILSAPATSYLLRVEVKP